MKEIYMAKATYHLYIMNLYNLVYITGPFCASKTVQKSLVLHFEMEGVYWHR
jgi:hypothetical protein